MKSLRERLRELAGARNSSWPDNWPKSPPPMTEGEKSVMQAQMYPFTGDRRLSGDYGAGPVGEDAWARTASEYPWSTASDAAHVRFASALAEFCAAIGIEGTLDNASVDQARSALRRMVAE